MFRHSCHFLLPVVQILLGDVYMVKVLTKKELCTRYRHPWNCDICGSVETQSHTWMERKHNVLLSDLCNHVKYKRIKKISCQIKSNLKAITLKNIFVKFFVRACFLFKIACLICINTFSFLFNLSSRLTVVLDHWQPSTNFGFLLKTLWKQV